MHIEHVAFALPDPAAAAAWYAEHLGFELVRASAASPFAHFLLAPGGGVMIEILHDADAGVPDYRQLLSLQGHLAFEVEDVDEDYRRLVAAGAAGEGAPALSPAGDRYAMLRDPWGVPLQLVTRAQRMM